jgi:formate-dependent phosphoribosylglycinamide formyltransferase (GAR transformylase)
MTSSPQKSLLCITSYEKGHEFIREAKRQGAYVILLSVTALEHANWPRESIDEVFYMPDLSKTDDVIHVVSFLARTRIIDSIVALDDYDVWIAANLREHLRLPGMGDTTVRHFRDKLAMRLKARENYIPVPDFIHVLNYNKLSEFMDRVPLPWILKPRAEASTIGIAKINSVDEFWSRIDTLGDRQSFFLLERFIPGEVYHVDSLTGYREVVFAEAHHYGKPPFNVYHEGGIFTSRTIPRESPDATTLKDLNRQIMSALGFVRGVAHTEFIKSHDDGHFYFLETAARVGGAYITEMIEAATGINLWREWAKIELHSQDGTYQLPEQKQNYAGVIVSLARQEYPDTSAYQDPEIVMRIDKRHHAGFVIASRSSDRVNYLLDDYTQRFINDFLATLPPSETRPRSTGT